MRLALSGALVLGAAVVFASPAVAAPPFLTSVGQIERHPTATWTLPSGVKSAVAEVATSPATSTDGYFFSENREAFDVPEETQTYWVDNSQLDPGVYYVHIGGIDEPCFYAGLCPVREFSQIMTLVIEAEPPPPPQPRYQASVRSTHPRAVRLRGNWTYLGDMIRVRFRNATTGSGDLESYRVCHTTGSSRLACSYELVEGRAWDEFKLRVRPALVYARRSVRRDITFTWRVEQRIVARRRINVLTGE